MKDNTETDETPAPKGSKVTASILGAFDLLRENKDAVKVTGGVRILSILQGNETNEKNVQYVLKRLVRSLGANVPDMRTGYFATLVTLLRQVNTITVTHLQELLKKELHANGSSKSEVGDVALGQILVCGAIFRSGLLLRASEEEQKHAITILLAASGKKSYLGTVAYLILLDLAKQLTEEQFSTVLWPHIKPAFKKEISEHSLDSLHFLLAISRTFPEKVKLRKLIGVSEVICEDTVPTICEKIMAGIDMNSVNHPIYKEIGTLIADSEHLPLFWSSIDAQLAKHNRNRELVAINLLATILGAMTTNHRFIPQLLSENFFRLFIDWFKGLQTASKFRNKRDDEDDHKVMIKKEKELLATLIASLKHPGVDSGVRVDVLKRLLLPPGAVNVAELTGSNVVKGILAHMDKDGLQQMGQLFEGILLNTTKKVIKEGVEKGWYNNERLKAAELISFLVNHEAAKDDTPFKLRHMRLLMCVGLFRVGGADNVAVSAELAGSIKASFYRCFTSKFPNVDTLVEVLSSLTSFVSSKLETETKQFPEETVECWSMVTEICQSIEQIPSKTKVDKVFLILLYQLGLFLFSEPGHVKMARSSIKELKSCYEHYQKGKKKKPKKANGDISLDEPEWIEVLVEVLLSILSTESSVLRSVVQCVFRLLWENLTPSSIGQIVSVLDPDSDSNPLTQSDSEEDDDDDENEDQEEEEDDDSEVDGEEKSDEEASATDGDEADDDDEDGETTISDQLRMAVQKALGGAADSDNESLDADMIGEEEGKKLDEALAEAFKQFHSGKGLKNKKDRKDKKSLADFRIRVLDLVDIYLEKEPSMDICLGMIGPLMRSLETCIQDSQMRELESRLRRTIKTLTRIRKFSSNDHVTLDILCDYLRPVVDKGERSHFMFQAVGDVVTHFATFIIHCSQRLQAKTPKKAKASPLTDILREQLQSYFKNRSCMLPVIFFHNILQLEWEGTLDLAPVVVDNIFNVSVRQFRRNEGLELLAGFYRALKRTKPTSASALRKLNSLEKSFESTLKSTFTTENKEFAAKNNYFNSLTKLIDTIKVFHESCEIATSIDFESMLKIVSAFKSVAKSNVVESNPQPKEQNGTHEGKKSKKKKKKRKNKQVNGKIESDGVAEPPTKKARRKSVSVSESA